MGKGQAVSGRYKWRRGGAETAKGREGEHDKRRGVVGEVKKTSAHANFWSEQKSKGSIWASR